MTVGAAALAFVAGVLTSLSPCVLPILPLILGAAASERKYGPVALAAGLAISFVVVGLFVATIGYSIGLGGELFRQGRDAALGRRDPQSRHRAGIGRSEIAVRSLRCRETAFRQQRPLGVKPADRLG